MNRKQTEAVRFVSRIRKLRAIGLGLGFFCVAGVLRENGAQPLIWLVLLANGFVWPQLAYLLALRSADPQRAEFRNLAFDSIMGGIWVAVMHFNVVPSAVLVVMLTIDKISVGGWRMLARTASLQIVACALAAAVLGFQFQPLSSMPEILLSLPFLLTYPVVISTVTYALAGKVRQQNKQLAELNRSDGLTGLFNHNYWEQVVNSEVRRHHRSERPASLMMIDIDHFKRVNDGHGHPVGDEVLRNVAAIIRNSVRDIDTAGRYGGDEFGVVLPELRLQDALKIAERIRDRVEAQAIGGDAGLRCTVSIGIAEIGRDVEEAYGWIAQADALLYQAKATGRNCVASVLDGSLQPLSVRIRKPIL